MKATPNNRSFKMMRSRLSVLFIIFVLVFLYLIVQLGVITFVDGTTYDQRVLYQFVTRQTVSEDIMPKRGRILDRNGIVLAENIHVYNLIFDPKTMIGLPETDQEAYMRFVSDQLEGVGYLDIKQILEATPTSQYRILARGMSVTQISSIQSAIETGSLKGFYFEGYYDRAYPYANFASHVLGMYDYSGSARYGVEQYYDTALTGTYGRRYGYLDADAFVKQEEILPVHGYHVHLTLDFTIQNYVETALETFMAENEAKSAHAVVYDPQSGEIIAMASYPDFNPEAPYDLSHLYTEDTLVQMSQDEKMDKRYDLWRNYNVSLTFEPGSTYKAMVLAGALEEGIVDRDSEFTCYGQTIVAGHLIRCYNNTSHGVQTYEEALQNSCNVAFIEIGQKMGRDLFYDYSQMYGIGQLTGVDMLGEAGTATNLYYTYDELNITELATSSFGQGFNMTAIQELAAFSALINGGFMYQPHVMGSITDDVGYRLAYNQPLVIRRVISKETSDIMLKSLTAVVTSGTGRRAAMPGYVIGGKTGTAEKGVRGEEKYVVSFIGFAAVEDRAELVTLVVIDEPESTIPGETPTSALAVSVFKNIMSDALPYWGVYSDIEPEPEPELENEMEVNDDGEE